MKRTHDEMSAEHALGNGHHEDTSEEENADTVPPYKAKSEPLPQSPVFTEEYKTMRDAISKLVKLLKEPILNSSYRDGVVEGLLEETKIRTTSNHPEEVRIALIGDMKTGKSSLINSILSIGMIARQGDAGTSCTWVVQEFGAVFPDQTKPFAAEVHFFGREDRHAIIRALLADYFRSSAKDEDIGDGAKDSEQTVEDYAVKRTVITAFRAVLVNRPEFATSQAAEEFLSRSTAEDDESVLGLLYDWTDDVLSSYCSAKNESDLSIRKEAGTAQQLLWDLAPCMYTVEERDGEVQESLWPFVSFIKFGLDVPLLQHNITLVDLPGLSDANKTRVANATTHLRRCTHYLIVAEIGRAEDNKFIRDHLSRGFMTRGSGRTILALTHADTIDEETEVFGSHKDFKLLDTLLGDLKALEQSKVEINKKIKAKGPDQHVLIEERNKISANIRQKKLRHQETRINMRSKSMVKKLQEVYSELTPDPHPLAVFCVGNAAYKKHQAGYDRDDSAPPSLSVDATNIPALRKHLFLAPAEAKLNESRHAIGVQLPALLSCFNLYVSRTHLARKDEIQKIVAEPLQLASECIETAFLGFSDHAEKHILAPVRDEEFGWTEEALTFCRGWAKTYTSQKHMQFLKRDGVQKGRGKNAASLSWNEDLVSIRSAEVRMCFQDFTPSIGSTAKSLIKSFNQLINNVMAKIKRDPQVTLMALQPFVEYLYREKGNIEPLVQKVIRNMQKDIGNVVSAVTSSSVDNHIVQAMLPIYAHAREMKGRVSTPKARLNWFERSVSSIGTGVWMTAHDLLKTQLQDLIAKHGGVLEMEMKHFFQGIEQRFQFMCSGKEVEEAEETELREKIKGSLETAKQLLETEVKPAAAACFGE